MTQRVNEDDVLKIAEAELSRRGVNIPDKDIQKSLKAVGFETTVDSIDDGWHVVYWVGTPWSASRIQLSINSMGEVSNYQFEPGE